METKTYATYTKQTYKCGVCGTAHESIAQRMNCERTCLNKQAEEERKAIEAKKLAEQKMRKEAVDEAIKKTAELMDAYIKDYGHYEYEGEPVRNFFWPNKLFSLF